MKSTYLIRTMMILASIALAGSATLNGCKKDEASASSDKKSAKPVTPPAKEHVETTSKTPPKLQTSPKTAAEPKIAAAPKRNDNNASKTSSTTTAPAKPTAKPVPIKRRPPLAKKPGVALVKPLPEPSEPPSLVLVHAANLQGDIEPCG